MANGQGKTTETAKNQSAGTAESRYTKEQILDSDRFANRRDILDTLLTDEKEYTIAEVKSIMSNWFKKGVE